MKKLLLFIICPFFLFGQTQIGENINGEEAGDTFGHSVSLSADGNIMAIGGFQNDLNGPSSGYVRIYRNNNSNWEQIGNDINGQAYNSLGYSVSLSSDGSIVAIGANGNAGYVRIYINNNSNWEQIGNDIIGEASGDLFGSSVSLSSDGSIIAIGAPFNDGNGSNSGHVRIYRNNNSNWEQIGNDIIGEGSNDWSGYAVSLSSDGSIIAIGAPFNDGNGSNSGHVRIYRNNNSNWEQIGNDINGEGAGDNSGRSVSLSSDGSIIAIGAEYNFGYGPNSGHVRVYKNNNNVWEQLGEDINGKAAGDRSGISVSLNSDGNIIAIGAIANINNGNSSGHVRIYKNNNGVWNQIGLDIDGSAGGDYFSFPSLSSDGGIVAIGGYGNDDNGLNSGHVRVYDLSAVLSTDKIIKNNFHIYPNPASKEFTIDIENLILEKVNIYNILGQLVKTEITKIINIENLKSGIYNLEIISNKGKSTKKLIIE